MSNEGYETRIGHMFVKALHRGGEDLLVRVEASLGVARRHLERVRTGQLTLVPAVVDEIERSLTEAEKLLEP